MRNNNNPNTSPFVESEVIERSYSVNPESQFEKNNNNTNEKQTVKQKFVNNDLANQQKETEIANKTEFKDFPTIEEKEREQRQKINKNANSQQQQTQAQTQTQNTQIPIDVDMPKFTFDDEMVNNEDDDNEDGGNPNEVKLASTTIKPFAKVAVNIVFNQILTPVSFKFASININETQAAAISQNKILSPEIIGYFEHLNQNTLTALTLTDEEQKNLIDSFVAFLKYKNVETANPETAFYVQLGAVIIKMGITTFAMRSENKQYVEWILSSQKIKSPQQIKKQKKNQKQSESKKENIETTEMFVNKEEVKKEE